MNFNYFPINDIPPQDEPFPKPETPGPHHAPGFDNPDLPQIYLEFK